MIINMNWLLNDAYSYRASAFSKRENVSCASVGSSTCSQVETFVKVHRGQ